jgi:hypothetical protein
VASSPPGSSLEIDFKEEVGVGEVERCVRITQIQLQLLCFIPSLFFMLKHNVTTICFVSNSNLTNLTFE